MSNTKPNITMSKVFNEWAKRFAKDPEQFGEILDKKGKPIRNYGDRCEAFYKQIQREMKAKK